MWNNAKSSISAAGFYICGPVLRFGDPLANSSIRIVRTQMALEFADGRWHVQGISLTELAEEWGTPLYVYDADRMVSQYKRLAAAFSGLKCKLKYATKALNNLAVIQLLHRQGAGLDAVSIQEAELGILAGVPAGEILFTPNSVAFEEIKKAVSMGVVLNIDNIAFLEQFGQEYGDTVPCCIRLNPHITAGGNSKIQTGHIDSKFGISILQLRHVLRIVTHYNIQVSGLHVHTGSDFLNADVFLQGAALIFEAAHNFKHLQFLDFGSGFKVAYKEGDIVTDIEELGQRMTEVFRAFCAEYGRELEIWFEPGKFLVSEAGLLISKVNVVKTTPSTVFVGIDSGLNHLIRPMMYDAYHHIINISNPEAVQRVYTVVGYICETDTFGSDRRLNEVRQGDLLAICNAGAYGFSMSSNYNSRLRPAEIMIYQGKAQLIRRRETLDDLVRTQVPMEF